MLVFENYATFSYSVLWKIYLKKHKTKSKIIYVLLKKHDSFFVLRYTLALIKHN